MYTAQEIDGVHIYNIDETRLTEVGHYIPSEKIESILVIKLGYHLMENILLPQVD